MTAEHEHRNGDEEQTTRIPVSPQNQYEYAGAPHHTGVIPPYFGGPGSSDNHEDPATPPTGRRSRKTTAGLLAAALLLGGVGGVAAAAGYEQVDGGTAAPLRTADTPSLSTGTSASSTSTAPQGSPEAVAAEVLPSVVKINVVGQTEAGSGSGIILTADGEILTNNHVVAVAGNGGQITVNFNDGSTAKATVVGTDPMTDLAVIEAEGVSGLTPATLGSSDNVRVGEEVLAIGSPFGLEATVTSGIVSSLNRPVSVGNEQGVTDTTYPAIQTDAAINPGNSGGPLVDLNGRVIGINSSIRSVNTGLNGESGSIGLGFAIPISKVLPIVEQLRNGETPTHALLGVKVSDQQTQSGLTLGAAIQSVTPGSAADKAGLRPGDVVTKVDGETIDSVESLVATIRGYRPGDTVTLTIQRGGDTQTLKATLESDAGSNGS